MRTVRSLTALSAHPLRSTFAGMTAPAARVADTSRGLRRAPLSTLSK
jgi:hypothetical protein